MNSVLIKDENVKSVFFLFLGSFPDVFGCWSCGKEKDDEKERRGAVEWSRVEGVRWDGKVFERRRKIQAGMGVEGLGWMTEEGATAFVGLADPPTVSSEGTMAGGRSLGLGLEAAPFASFSSPCSPGAVSG